MKTQYLKDSSSTDELCHAAHVTLRASGKPDTANLVKYVTNTTPKRATRNKKAFSNGRRQNALSCHQKKHYLHFWKLN